MNSLPPGEEPAEGSGRRRIAVDACVLINLLRLGRLDILDESTSLFPVVTKSVLNEITDEDQRRALDSSCTAGRIDSLDPVDPAAVSVFIDAIERGLGRGEASCIALSAAAGILLGCDERAGCFMRVVEANGLSGRIVTTRDLMIMAIREGRLRFDEANGLLDALRTRFKYNVPGIQRSEIHGNRPAGSD